MVETMDAGGRTLDAFADEAGGDRRSNRARETKTHPRFRFPPKCETESS